MPPPSNIAKITRSETSTSKAASSPIGDELKDRQPSDMQSQVPLLESLNAFANSITSAASLTMRRDLAKQQAVEQQRERDRQSKLRSIFLTLVEDAESRIQGIEKVSIDVEKQLDLSSQAQSRNAATLIARLSKQAEVSSALLTAHDRAHLKDDVDETKADLEITKKEIGNSRDYGRDIADLQAGLKTAGKKIDKLDREAVTSDKLRKKLRDLATIDELRERPSKDEVRALISKDDLRRVTTDDIRKHVTEALIPTEKTLASLTLKDASLSAEIKDVEAFMQKKGEEQSSRFAHLDTELGGTRMDLSRLDLEIQGQERDHAAIKRDLGAQSGLLIELSTCVKPDASNNVPSLDIRVMRNSDQIKLLREDCEKLHETVRQTQALEAASKATSSQIPTTSTNADTKIVEEVKLLQNALSVLKAEQEDLMLIRHDLDAFKADQEKVELIRTDLDSLINEEKQKDVGLTQEFEKQHEDLARLQTEMRLVKQSQASRTISNHPPTPPFAHASMSPRESDQQRLQLLEIDVRELRHNFQTLDVFVNSQQQKFDRLTTDRLVQSMVHQMQQMYPQHPGNLIAWQSKVDSYLGGSLKDRLVAIESQIVQLINARREWTQEIDQLTLENRKISASIVPMKQDIGSLKQTALYKDFAARIDELANRITTVEAKYNGEISDLQKTQTDLVHNVIHLQHRRGVDSARGTPRELTVMSRSSKSIEPVGTTTIFCENTNDSDCSDAPLSRRTYREEQQDREDHRPSEPNLKRRVTELDGEDEDEGEEAGPTNVRKVVKRRNVSGQTLFS